MPNIATRPIRPEDYSTALGTISNAVPAGQEEKGGIWAAIGKAFTAYGKAMETPGFRHALASMGESISPPGSVGQRLGTQARTQIEGQGYNQYLSQLLATPAGGAAPTPPSYLPPEMLGQAFTMSQAQRGLGLQERGVALQEAAGRRAGEAQAFEQGPKWEAEKGLIKAQIDRIKAEIQGTGVAAAEPGTITTKEVNGEPHSVLIGTRTGRVISDLGLDYRSTAGPEMTGTIREGAAWPIIQQYVLDQGKDISLYIDPFSGRLLQPLEQIIASLPLEYRAAVEQETNRRMSIVSPRFAGLYQPPVVGGVTGTEEKTIKEWITPDGKIAKLNPDGTVTIRSK